MADNPTCATCRWWADPYARYPEAVRVPNRWGECHRLAPTKSRPEWPETQGCDWCGEHAPRVEAPVVGVDFAASSDRTVILVRTFEEYARAAVAHGLGVEAVTKPGDSFTVGRVTWLYRPKESPDASV